MNLSTKYELFGSQEPSGRRRTYSAREKSSGRPVLVHLFDLGPGSESEATMAQRLLREAFNLPSADRGQVIEVGDYNGVPCVVTDFPLGVDGLPQAPERTGSEPPTIAETPLSAGSGAQHQTISPSIGHLAGSSSAQLPGLPEPPSVLKTDVTGSGRSPDETVSFTGIYEKGLAQPTASPELAAPTPREVASGPRLTEGELTRLLRKPPATAESSEAPMSFTSLYAPAHGGAASVGGSSTGQPPVTPQTEQAASFTGLFATSSGKDKRQTSPAERETSVPSPDTPIGAPSFTSLFDVPSAEAVEPAKAPPATREGSSLPEVGSFSSLFHTPAFGSHSGGAPPSGENLAGTPPERADPGLFTFSHIPKPPSEAPVSQMPAKTETKDTRTKPEHSGASSRIYPSSSAPPVPAAASGAARPPEPPSASQPTEFTQLFQVPRSGVTSPPAGGPSSAPQASSQETSGVFTKLFASSPLPVPQPEASASGDAASFPHPVSPSEQPDTFTSLFASPEFAGAPAKAQANASSTPEFPSPAMSPPSPDQARPAGDFTLIYGTGGSNPTASHAPVNFGDVSGASSSASAGQADSGLFPRFDSGPSSTSQRFEAMPNFGGQQSNSPSLASSEPALHGGRSPSGASPSMMPQFPESGEPAGAPLFSQPAPPPYVPPVERSGPGEYTMIMLQQPAQAGGGAAGPPGPGSPAASKPTFGMPPVSPPPLPTAPAPPSIAASPPVPAAKPTSYLPLIITANVFILLVLGVIIYFLLKR